MRIVRLCVAKRDETLIEAAARISAYTAAPQRECSHEFSSEHRPATARLAGRGGQPRALSPTVLAPLAGTTDLVRAAGDVHHAASP